MTCTEVSRGDFKFRNKKEIIGEHTGYLIKIYKMVVYRIIYADNVTSA